MKKLTEDHVARCAGSKLGIVMRPVRRAAHRPESDVRICK